MTTFSFITASDIHISDTNPRSRIDDFRETMLGKLTQMGKACQKLSVDAALIAGDLFNLKNPARNSHELNRELVNVFKEFGCPVYMIEGNHDLTGNNLESLKRQPLGVLFADKTLIQLRSTIIEKEGTRVSLVGVPYSEPFDLDKVSIPSKEGCIAQICLMHIYASPTPGMLFKDQIYGYRELMHLSPDIFVLGHYHIDQGIVCEGGKHFINIGSMSRGSIADEDMEHHPQIGFIRITKDEDKIDITAQSIRLKVKQASEIFNLEKRAEEKQELKDIEVFVDKLSSEVTSLPDQQDGDLVPTIESMDVPREIKERVMKFIQEATAIKCK